MSKETRLNSILKTIYNEADWLSDDEYMVVHADNEREACEAFSKKYKEDVDEDIQYWKPRIGYLVLIEDVPEEDNEPYDYNGADWWVYFKKESAPNDILYKEVYIVNLYD